MMMMMMVVMMLSCSLKSEMPGVYAVDMKEEDRGKEREKAKRG